MKKDKGEKTIIFITCEQCGFIKDGEVVDQQISFECPCCGLYEIEVSEN